MKKLLSIATLSLTSAPALAHSGHSENAFIFAATIVIAFYILKPVVLKKIKIKK